MKPTSSAKLNVAQASRAISQTFREGELDDIARRTGFLKRKRDVTPLPLIAGIVSTLGASNANWLADILRTFNAFTGKNVQYKPFHNQLSKNGFPVFMHALLERVLSSLTMPIIESIPATKLAKFKDILLHDGTSFAIKDSLKKSWPGRFKKVSPAAVELHVTMSVFEDNPIAVTLAPDKDAERQYSPDVEGLKGKLLLEDRGYQDRDTFREICAAGGYFVIRGTKNIRPTIVRAFAGGERRRGLEGKTLSWSILKREDLDLDIEWGQGEHKYTGRLIVFYSPDKKNRRRFTYLHTNLDRGEFSAHEVGLLYRLRWQIELLFKEWKSFTNLRGFDTSKENIAEGLIWGSLLAATFKRFVTHGASLAAGFELSTQRAACCAKHYLDEILRSLLNGGRKLTAILHSVFRYLADNAPRAHPERDRRKGRFSAGIRQRAGA